MLPFVGTRSYGDRTSATTMVQGDKPSFMVVRCRSVTVGMRHGGRYQRRYQRRREVRYAVSIHDNSLAVNLTNRGR